MMRTLSTLILFTGLGLSGQAEAQLMARPNAGPAVVADEAELPPPGPAAAAPNGRDGPSGSLPPQAPIQVDAITQLLQTMAGPRAANAPVFARCDASETNIGGNGQAVVAQNVYIINTGRGKCPPIGASVRLPRSLLEVAQ